MTRQYPGATTEQLDPEDDYDGYDDVVYYEDTGRWRWVAALAAAVLALAVIGTVVILRGGDTATTAGRIVPSSAAPVTTPPRPAATTPSRSLPPETMTTVTPSATTSTEAAPPSPQADPRTITYTVSGTRQPGDFVTVTYLDESGMPRTDFNVTLPWTKTVVGANVVLNSVTAVSVASHLNCSITDANGQIVASQDYNTIATTCNR